MASLDTVFDLLRSEQRRYALYYLSQQDGPVPIDKLAEEVAKMEEDFEAGDIADDEIRRYEVEFRHSDLPKADEAAFIDYEPDEGIVRLTGKPPEFEAILSVAKVIEKPLRD